MLTTLIADDLTGACDAGALFAGRSRVGVVIDAGAVLAAWPVAVVDTETRALSTIDACARVTAVVARLGQRRRAGVLFKKIDSTLRGSVGAELCALLSATRRASALVCPAFPAQCRTVVDGVLRVDGSPAHLSPIGRDPAYPGSTSDVADIVRRGATRPVSRLPLPCVRGGAQSVARALGDAAGDIIVADAQTEADLDAIAVAAHGRPEVVLAGSAGLARAVAATLGHGGPPPPLPEGRAWLILAGSLHPATRAQLRVLEEAGVAGVRLDGRREPDVSGLIAVLESGRPGVIFTSDEVATAPGARGETAARLARLSMRVLARTRPDLVAVTGGETAIALLRALGSRQIDLAGAPASGLALGDAIVGGASVLPLLTKAGGFGAPDLFCTLLKGPAR
jgi:D-threonate/D-erythronate kinase